MIRCLAIRPSLTGSCSVVVSAGIVALALFAAVLGGVANASTVSFSGDVLTYNAAAGEENALNLRRGSESFSCGSRPAPCFVVEELGFSVAITSFPAGRCSQEAGTPVECDVPARVVVNLGDRDDNVGDWDGPSQINGGSGDDFLLGKGGNDAVNGGPGSDSLAGDEGNDTLDGGDGDDDLEGNGVAIYGHTAGSDVYIGGPGRDIVDYGARDDALSISLDGAANDGAPGEADNAGADVERVRGGIADDVLIGSAAANTLEGERGNDTLRGGDGEDALFGDDGDDRLQGEGGQDTLQGANGNDELDGGAGIDEFNGDGEGACNSCGSGMDRILARDGLNEQVRCGAGEDSAILDPGDLISQDCERRDVGSSPGDGGTTPGGGGATPGGGGTSAGGGGTTPAGGGTTAGGGGTTPGPTTATPRKADPYVKCRRLKGNKKKACVSKVRALKRCSKLKGNKKKACIKKAMRRFSGTRRR
ncbi:MAG: hypothetical protein M3N47_12075 [Chloroflexota bacterium]|nr:hypothetical protein [Chloroflexota bacterium]